MEGQVVILCTGSVVSLHLCSSGLSLLSSWELVPAQADPLIRQVSGKLEIRSVLCVDFVVLFAAAHWARCPALLERHPWARKAQGSFLLTLTLLPSQRASPPGLPLIPRWVISQLSFICPKTTTGVVI